MIKPRLRGWLHAGMLPIAVVAAVVLFAFSPTPAARFSSAIYGMTAASLFAVSALYHRGRWSRPTQRMLMRMDHANIFLVIAGSYTPFAYLLLSDRGGARMLWIVWTGAVLGVLFRVFWVGAPRWLYAPAYIGMGWIAAFYLDDIYSAGGAAVLVTLLVGGLFYSFGGVVYALRRPNPWPRWFGFHEVFHACTLCGFISHYIAISLLTYTV